MAVVGISYDAGLNTNKKLSSALARGRKHVTGTLNFSAKLYIGGGVTTPVTGLSSVYAMFIQPKSGITFEYDYSSTALTKLLIPGTATNTTTVAALENALQEIASDTACSFIGTVRFFAVGS